MIKKPAAVELSLYAGYYIDLVEENDLLAALHSSQEAMLELLETYSEDRGEWAYAEGKWNTREVVCHIIDAERIFAYRAFRFSRKDRTPLPGFEEDDYIRQTKTMQWNWGQIANDFLAVRSASISLYSSLTPDMLDFVGIANDKEYTARMLGYMTVGHQWHHVHVLKTKYAIEK
jgi:hypothetical protein